MEQAKAEAAMERIEKRAKVSPRYNRDGTIVDQVDRAIRDGLRGHAFNVAATEAKAFLPHKLWRTPDESEAQFVERAKTTYGGDCTLLYGRNGTIRSAQAQRVASQTQTPVGRGVLKDCWFFCNYPKGFMLTCNDCGHQGFGFATRVDSSQVQVHKVEDAVKQDVMCPACGTVDTLEDLVSLSDRKIFHKRVNDWLLMGAIVPKAPTHTRRKHAIHLGEGGEIFECTVEAPDGTPHREIVKLVESLFRTQIKEYVRSQGRTPLPGPVKHVGGPHAPNQMYGIGNIPNHVPAPPPLGIKDLMPYDDYTPSAKELEMDYKEFKGYKVPEEPKCEADKPVGTRDVDKFQKEQQDKLWSDLFS
jgi:hypothetical protein